MILYHYGLSPFSEKIRLMLGYTALEWQSLIVPVYQPRPVVDELVGGYRRVPMAQLGADIFCDSRIIAAEIADLADKPELSPEKCDAVVANYIAVAEYDVVCAILGCANKWSLLTRVVKEIGVLKTPGFIRDRLDSHKENFLRPPPYKEARCYVFKFLDELNNRLKHSNFLGGVKPNIEDFVVWYLLWVGGDTFGVPLMMEYQMIYDWYRRMENFGHGHPEEIDIDAVIATAQGSPRALPDSTHEYLLGQEVVIAPNDYARAPSSGMLVANTESRWVVARQTSLCGLVHVHFPKAGYDIFRKF